MNTLLIRLPRLKHAELDTRKLNHEGPEAHEGIWPSAKQGSRLEYFSQRHKDTEFYMCELSFLRVSVPP